MMLNRIELFISIAKSHNLAKTAEALNVSTSSVCQRLKSLESDFGVKLYRRSRHGIELTTAGHSLVATASEVLNCLDTLRTQFRQELHEPVESLRVAGTYNPSVKYLPSALAVFQKTHPAVKVDFLTSNKEEIEKLVRQFEVDIAVVQSASQSSDVSVEHCAVDELTLFAHSSYALSKKTKLELQQLANKPLIIRNEAAATEKLLTELRRQGLTLNITMRCVSPYDVKAAVLKKIGIGILFYNHIEEDVKRHALKVLKPAGLPVTAEQSSIIYSKKKPLSAVAADFLSILQSLKKRQCRTLPPHPH